MGNFLAELRRRHVVRVGVAYLVVAWLVVQVVNNLIPLMGIPLWTGKLILLVLAAGLPVALVLAWAYELTPDGIKRNVGSSNEPAIRRGFGRKWDFLIIAGLLVGLGYSVWQRHSPAPPQPAEATEPSIAVLPFADMSPNKDQEYFSDGLSEELLNQLAHLQGLRVIGRTSSFAFKGENEDLRKIGETLGVDHILEGSVRKSGNELRITAQLINAADGSHLWSQTYNRTLEDVFAVQEEISRTVAKALSVSIGALDLGEGGTSSFAAYDAYLSGNAQQYQSGADNVLMGISDFERAVEIDPEFIQAWSGLYNLYRQATLNFGDHASEWLAKMAAAGDRVIALAPDSATANLVLADRAFFTGDFAEAGRLLRAISNLPPNLSQQGHLEDCLFLFDMGRVRDSVACHERMVQTDPLSVIPAMNLQAGYEVVGDVDRAKAESERVRSFATDPSLLNVPP